MCPVARRRRGLRRDLNGSALPTLPQSVSRGARFRGFTGSRLLRPVRLLAPLDGSDRVSPATGGFYIQASGGLVARPAAGYDYNSTGLLCWRDFHPQEWQLASLHQTRRAGRDPEALAALGPAGAEIRILVDVRLIHRDHAMAIALSALQHALELLDERLSPLRVGPAQQLLGLLPRQLAAVQGRADRLATAPQPEALTRPMDEAAQRPARGWIRPFYGWGGGRALSGADRLAEFGFALRAKKGRRPPVRRNVSALGPP